MQSVNPIWMIILKNTTVKRLLSYLKILGCLILGLSGVYFSIYWVMIPFYFDRQSSNQQIALENQLYTLSKNEPQQWQEFENALLPRTFSDDKIKAALKSIATSYYLTMVECDLCQEKRQDMVVKVGSLTLEALLDSRILSFIDHLKNKLSGALRIKVVKLHRGRDLTEDLLPKIQAGQVNDLVKAEIEFEWLSY